VPHCLLSAFVIDDFTGALLPAGRLGRPGVPPPSCGEVDPADCLCGRGTSAEGPLLTCDTAKREAQPPCDGDTGGGVHLVLPLAVQGRVFGVLHVQLEPGCRPSLNEQAFLPGAAAVIAVGLMHRRARREQQRLEAQFHQAQRMEAIGRLAGGVAHDFNNILTAITNYADLGLLRLEPASPLRRNFEEILTAADRAALLTQQLLAFSRRQVLSPRVLDLNAVIGEMVKMLRRLLGSDIDLAVFTEDGLPRIFADSGQIEQIVINLALNARDAMPRGGKLKIETAATSLLGAGVRGEAAASPPSYVRLRITDTGAAVNVEPAVGNLNLSSANGLTRPGTGLGLAAVEGIVRESGGHVVVDSGPLTGTAFSIYFPAARDAEQPEPHAPQSALPRGTETILLAEDDDSVRIVIVEVLHDLGYRVLEARDGSEALAVAGAHPGRIDLLLTDVVMPGMSGTALHGRLLKTRPGLRLLLVSGTDDAVARHGILAHGMAFLQKPFSPWALATRLREALDAAPPSLAP
jgi:signal transduction histidine kinase